MRRLLTILAAGLLVFMSRTADAQTFTVGHFSKVIVSPYIQVTFVQGAEESVTINNIMVDSSKLHVEVQGGTLRLYLDGARDLPQGWRDYKKHDRQNGQDLYPHHAVNATVVYKKLHMLSLRGSETFLCKSPIIVKHFTLRAYGDSKITIAEVHIGSMHTTIYGESSLEIKEGEVDEQHYTCYGDGKINATTITGDVARLTAFGEAEFNLNVSERIRITAFGEARLRYKGNPEIVKGINIGGVDLARID